jgi:hypothetical protein
MGVEEVRRNSLIAWLSKTIKKVKKKKRPDS